MSDSWEDRLGEPPDLSSVVCWVEDGYFAFWDEENEASPLAIIERAKIRP